MVVLPHEASLADLQTKAKLYIDIGIEKVKWSKNVPTVEISPRKSVAIVGGNASSIALSQHLLDAGFKVFLIYRGNEISIPQDELTHIHSTLIYVTRHPRFNAVKNARPKDFFGYPGDYTLKLISGDEKIELSVGVVVLSFENDPGLIKMSQSTFHMDIDEDGSLAALNDISARAHTRERGVFIINPVKVENTDISQKFLAADSAASMVIDLLNRNEIHHRVTVSQVKENLCAGCGACVKTCMFNAVSLHGNPKVSVIDPRRCRGCGNCVTACPAGARDLIVSPTEYLFNSVDILSRFKPEDDKPLMLALACEGCGYENLDQASQNGLTWPVGIMPLSVVCGGQIDMQLVMHAFVKGFEGVIMVICGEGCCHNLIGNVDLERRVNLFKEILVSRGFDPGRMHVCATCARDDKNCVEKINQFYCQFDADSQPAGTLILDK